MTAASPLNIAILAGGQSAEREVSLASAAAIEEALRGLGHQTHKVDVSQRLAHDLADIQPDVVFNALHGQGGEDGVIQGFLETLGYLYTHSDVKSSAVAMDKKLTKHVLASENIDFADDKIVLPSEIFAADPMPRPYVVKALDEGSSVSVVIVTDDSLPNPISADLDGPWQSYARLMVEEYIPGQELSVAVLGGKALGVIELRTTEGFYDYKAKYTDGVTQHIMPADVSNAVANKACTDAETAHIRLGCRGVTRSDFRYDPATGRLVFLEINTQPGMTQLSLVPEIAAYAGIDFKTLVSAILDDAMVRQ